MSFELPASLHLTREAVHSASRMGQGLDEIRLVGPTKCPAAQSQPTNRIIKNLMPEEGSIRSRLCVYFSTLVIPHISIAEFLSSSDPFHTRATDPDLPYILTTYHYVLGSDQRQPHSAPRITHTHQINKHT
jgi:hypothetical protein